MRISFNYTIDIEINLSVICAGQTNVCSKMRRKYEQRVHACMYAYIAGLGNCYKSADFGFRSLSLIC